MPQLAADAECSGQAPHQASQNGQGLRIIGRVETESWRGQRTDRLLDDAVVALMASSLANDPELEEAHAKFERSRAAFDRQLEAYRETHKTLATAYRRLERDTQLDNDTLSLLVKPFTGDPEAPFEEVARPGRKTFENLERILVFLESTRGEWQVVDGGIRFEDEVHQVTSQALWEEFLEHRHEMEKQAVSRMRSFQDYAR